MSIFSTAVRFNTDADTIREHLTEIAAEWADLGITTPVIDEHDQIDEDALIELADRV